MADTDISNMKLVDLKRELRARGFKVTGNENELVVRLQSGSIIHANKSKCQSKQGAKRKKLNHEEVEQSAIIFKIPTEILEYLFDYLSLKDLSAVSATCKQMQQIAGRIYQQNYSGILPEFDQSNRDWNVPLPCYDREIDFTYFIPFIDKAFSMCEFLDPQSKFQQLKQLTIHGVDYDTGEIDRKKDVLNKLEYLQIRSFSLTRRPLENSISLPPNLKRLYLNDVWCGRGCGGKWYECSYPTLEHCEITGSIGPISKFLTLNPNIRKFGTDAKNLWDNRKEIKASEVKLEELAIEITSYYKFQLIGILSFCRLLEDLHQLGVYKRLNLCYACIKFDQDLVDGLSNLTAINRLTVPRYASIDNVALSGLTNLEDISFPDSRCIIDIDIVATKSEHLKFVHFGISNLSHVKLFMCGNSRLERIQIDWFMDEAGNIENEKVLNLIELSKERGRLSSPNKVTLFVQESIYLATKRVKSRTDLDFVKLKRTHSLNEREFDFSYPEIYPPTTYYIH